MKAKTNDQALKKLFKAVDGTIYSALLRERLLQIMDLTEESINEQPEKWANGFISPALYTELIDIVRENIGFEQ
jgi:hypothetical protein